MILGHFKFPFNIVILEIYLEKIIRNVTGFKYLYDSLVFCVKKLETTLSVPK